MKRVILHSDINHCYAQIEEMKNPYLKQVPMAVGGNEEKRHGVILAKNLLAKKYHIKTGESLQEAYQKCPDLVVIPPNYKEYIFYTEKVKSIYREYTDQVESFGLDEAWLDVSASTRLFGSGEQIARLIQKRILHEWGLTVSIGISFNKVFAKIASDMVKPSGFVVITEDNYKDIIWKLPVEDLFYVGRATKEKLACRCIQTIGDLAKTRIEYLRSLLGKMGEVLHYFANGYDDSEVTLTSFRREVKSIGNSITAIHDIYNEREALLVFYVLVEAVASRLRNSGYKGSLIRIHLRDTTLHSFSRQRKIAVATNIVSEIMDVVKQLLQEHYSFHMPLRSIGVSVSKLIPDSAMIQYQLFMDEEKRLKDKRLDMTIDEIRAKFGFHSLKRCCLLLDEPLTDFDPKADHIIHPVGYF